MRIAQLAPTYERVPPAGYGGTELVVGLITEELVRRGHHVTLYASGDSETSATLRSVTSRAVRYGDVVDGVRHAEYFQLMNAQTCFIDAAAGAFDIVHNHAGIEGLVLAAHSRTPRPSSQLTLGCRTQRCTCSTCSSRWASMCRWMASLFIT